MFLLIFLPVQTQHYTDVNYTKILYKCDGKYIKYTESSNKEKLIPQIQQYKT